MLYGENGQNCLTQLTRYTQFYITQLVFIAALWL